jgi:hypothetical protein
MNGLTLKDLLPIIGVIIQVFLVFAIHIRLKKAEIRFSNLHNLQVDSLKNLYSKYVDLHYANISLFSSSTDCESELIEKIDKWDEKLRGFYYYFNQNRILLSDSLANELFQQLQNYRDVRGKLLKQKAQLEEDDFRGGDELSQPPDFEYDGVQDRIKIIKSMSKIPLAGPKPALFPPFSGFFRSRSAAMLSQKVKNWRKNCSILTPAGKFRHALSLKK